MEINMKEGRKEAMGKRKEGTRKKKVENGKNIGKDGERCDGLSYNTIWDFN